MEKILINPRENMIERIAMYLSENSKSNDFSHVKVIFPNKRPKHFLIKYLSKEINKPFYPPSILSMDEFIDELFQSIFPESLTLSPIESIYVLFEIFSKFQANSGEIEYKGLFDSFERFFPLGIKIFQAFEELFIEEVSAKQLKSYEYMINFYDSLSKVYDEFYIDLEEKNLATRAFKYKKVAERLTPDYLKDIDLIMFCGFFGLTKAEQIILRNIENWAGNGKFDGKLIFWLYDQKIFDKNKPEIEIYESPDRHGQVYMLREVLKKSSVDENSVIVLPSEDLLFPLLRQGLSDLEDNEYNVSMGYPIIRTPLWSFFDALWQTHNSIYLDEKGNISLPLSEYLQLVLHPYVKNLKLKGEAAPTRNLFHMIESYLTQQEGMTISLNELESELLNRAISGSELLKDFSLIELKKHMTTLHDKLIRSLLRIENLRDFTKKSIDILRYIYENSTARFNPLFFPFYSTFVEELNKISNSIVGEISFNDVSVYFSFLKNHLKLIHTPFEGIPVRGLQVLGFLETRNLRFKNVYFLDLNEEIFPPIYEDFLLPLRVRQFLSLPTFEDREKLIEYYFSNLINGADKVCLFYVKNERTEKSRFLEKIIWQNQKNKREINKYRINYKVNLSADKPIPIKKENFHLDFLREFNFSPSSIDIYLKCPLRFYYSQVLRLRERDDNEIDSTQIGTIVHNVLASFFKRFENRGKINSRNFRLDLINSIIDEEFKTRYGSPLFGSPYLIREQIRKRLKEFLNKYYSKIISQASLEILGVEYPFVVELKSLKIKGRIDIIENRGDGIYVVDFKTTGTPDRLKVHFNRTLEMLESYTMRLKSGESALLAHFLEKAIASIQLPVYVFCYSKLKSIPIINLRGVYLLLGKAKVDRTIAFDPFSNALSIEEAMRITEIFLEKFSEELLNPDIPFYPTKNFRVNCPYCDFRTTCGTLWVRGIDY